MNIKRNTRGDTIIEVLLASVILSIVLAGAYSLSSKASRINQTSYERTKASNLVQEQAELLRAVRANDLGIWDSITDVATYPDEPYYDCRAETAQLSPDTSTHAGVFYLDADTTTSPSTIVVNSGDKTTDDLYHTWTARENDGASGYYDFYIYTCWEGLGSIGNQVSGAVVRLEAN